MVSLEKYNCLCTESEGLTLLNAKKTDAQFLKCKKGECGFFCKTDEFHDYIDVVENKVLQEHTQKKTPIL